MSAESPTSPSAEDARRKLALYRAAGGVLAAIVTGATAFWGPRAPWLSSVLALVEAVVLFGIGKALGVPIESVTQLALSIMAAKRPERAESVALATLQSLPPERTTAVTQQLFESLPPSARARASITPPPGRPSDAPTTIQFVGLDSAEDDGNHPAKPDPA